MNTTLSKIIVIDSDKNLHEAYRNYFESYLGYDLQAVYTSVADALVNFDELRPHIVFSEVDLPGTNGIEGIQLFRKKDPQVKIIMLSANKEFNFVKKAFKKTANGYLSKPLNERKLYNALDSLSSSGATISNDIVSEIVAKFQGQTNNFFSERENQVIEYLCQGATYKSIAEKLFVTASAINFHIQNIYLKLNVNSKSEALQKLREMNFSPALI